MPIANFIFTGNVIKELSKNLPSPSIAINELIKNSYDADASTVDICFDSKEKFLSIADDGSGMDTEDIASLFHIAESNKEYGKLKDNGRYVQGEKGLGFLSIFKFGEIIKCQTYKNKGISFSIDYNELIKQDNASDFPVVLEDSKKSTNGTLFHIDLSEQNTIDLSTFFSSQKNIEKILFSMKNEGFQINLSVDGKTFNSCKCTNIKDVYIEKQLYYIKYKSDDSMINYFYNNVLIHQEPFEIKKNLYSLDLELIIFDFTGFSNPKAQIPDIFKVSDRKISPITYINDNFFDNSTLFDTALLRDKKSGLSLPQMIGYVNIYSNNNLTFNADRTQFSQSETSNAITQEVEQINKLIQETGVSFKSCLVKRDWIVENAKVDKNKIHERDYLKSFIKPEFAFIDKVKILVDEQNKKTIYNFCNIIKEIEFVDIPKNNTLPDNKNPNGSTTSPDDKKNGNNTKDETGTGNDNKQKGANDSQGGNMTPKKIRKKTLQLPTLKENYDFSINYHLNTLFESINDLDINKQTCIIACCLRCLFEMSVQALKDTQKYNWLDDKSENAITNILDRIDKKCIQIIKESTSMSYHDVDNLINKNEIINYFKISNLGSHKSTQNLTQQEIETIAKYASVFVLITNEMINNDDFCKEINK